MNAGVTAERVYQTLKHRILERWFRPGDRLDPAALAETLGSSATPVRDALHLLTGEGLVETRTSGGFHLPQLDAPALQDLYDWNAEIVLLAVKGWPRALASTPAEPDSAAGAAGLFAQIADRSGNAEHRRAVASANDRLNQVRLIEPLVVAGDDINALRQAVAAADIAGIRRFVIAYHRRRSRAAAAIVRALYRGIPMA